jgi:hypothetical protein
MLVVVIITVVRLSTRVNISRNNILSKYPWGSWDVSKLKRTKHVGYEERKGM